MEGGVANLPLCHLPHQLGAFNAIWQFAKLFQIFKIM
jgi:hypothetical protein